MIVALHGFTGGPASWSTALPSAVAPTLLGHDGRPPDGTAPRTWDEAIEALADRLAPYRGARAVGYSLGARTLLGLLARDEGLFRAAVFVGINPGLDDAERPARVAWEDSLARQLLQDGLQAFVDGWEALDLWRSQARLPETVRTAQRRVRMSHHPAGLAHSLRVQGLGRMPDLRGALDGLGIPHTLLVGGLDRKFLRLTDRLASRRVVVPDVGHNVVLEAPGAVREWLDRYEA